MGADSRMYSHVEYEKLNSTIFLNWPSYKGEISLPQLAVRIIQENNIVENSNIGGSSLGGMVASEIAKQIKINKLILIGSSNIPDRVNYLLKSLSNFSKYAPIKLVQFLIGKTPALNGNELMKMFEEADHKFIRNMCKAIFEWRGNPVPDSKVYAIHGIHDKVIYPPKDNVTLINGGHLIAMTHPKEVTLFLFKSTRA